MLHTRRQIIVNQNTFKREIVEFMKKDFSKTTKELSKIETEDVKIIEEKEKLIKARNKIKINKEIEKFFISEKNIYPHFYAWWNNETQEVEINKYDN